MYCSLQVGATFKGSGCEVKQNFFIVLVISPSLKNGSGWGRSMLREGFHLFFKATNSPGR